MEMPQNVPVSSFYLEMQTVKFASNKSCLIYGIDIRRSSPNSSQRRYAE